MNDQRSATPEECALVVGAAWDGSSGVILCGKRPVWRSNGFGSLAEGVLCCAECYADFDALDRRQFEPIIDVWSSP